MYTLYILSLIRGFKSFCYKHFIALTYLAPKKLVRLSEVTDCGLGMLSFPKDGCLLLINKIYQMDVLNCKYIKK